MAKLKRSPVETMQLLHYLKSISILEGPLRPLPIVAYFLDAKEIMSATEKIKKDTPIFNNEGQRKDGKDFSLWFR